SRNEPTTIHDRRTRKGPPVLFLRGCCSGLVFNPPTVSQTIAYLQSESAEGGIEIGLLVNYLLYDSIKAGASDIHIEPLEMTLVVRIRVSGVLTELVHLPLDLQEKISGRFKVMASLVSYQ